MNIYRTHLYGTEDPYNKGQTSFHPSVFKNFMYVVYKYQRKWGSTISQTVISREYLKHLENNVFRSVTVLGVRCGCQEKLYKEKNNIHEVQILRRHSDMRIRKTFGNTDVLFIRSRVREVFWIISPIVETKKKQDPDKELQQWDWNYERNSVQEMYYYLSKQKVSTFRISKTRKI